MNNSKAHTFLSFPITNVIALFYFLAVLAVFGNTQPGAFSEEEVAQQSWIQDMDTPDAQASLLQVDLDGNRVVGTGLAPSRYAIPNGAGFLPVAAAFLSIKNEVAQQKGFYLPMRSGIDLA